MKISVIFALTISFLIGCATTLEERYDEYENSIQIGNKIIRINKDFRYAGNLSSTHDKEYLDGPSYSTKMVFGEHFFMHNNADGKIDKTIIIYTYTLTKVGDYWREEVNFKKSKQYLSHMHLGSTKINNKKCACVVKKWPYIGERYVKFARGKGYEFDKSKHCIIEAKIGKTISRSTIMHVSYLEGSDSCESIRNEEGQNSEIIQTMLSKFQSHVNIKW